VPVDSDSESSKPQVFTTSS